MAALSADITLTDVLTSWGLPAVIIGMIVFIVAFPSIAKGVTAIAKVLWSPVRLLAPSFYTKAAREDLASRRSIAQLLLQNMDLTESDIGWSRQQFYPTQVTLESLDSPRYSVGLLGFRKRSTVYRTNNIIDALANDSAPILHLIGKPGSGKSVALRRLARITLEELRDSKRKATPLALYVNLREFSAKENPKVSDLTAYLDAQLNPRNSPELSKYLNKRLQADIKHGRVLILLDSFDEIPAVVGSSKISPAIRPYVEVINGLMNGGKSRAIVASREYKGPPVGGWPRVEIAPLSFEEQLAMLRAYGLDQGQIERVQPLLRDTSLGFAADLRRPLELSLLARYVTERDSIPDNRVLLFKSLVEAGLRNSSDGDAHIEKAALRCLEDIAVDTLQVNEHGLTISSENLDHMIKRSAGKGVSAHDVLEAILGSGLIVRELARRRGRRIMYSFVHRRVLEYLVTNQVLGAQSPVSGRDLAISRQWRELAVAVLQLGDDRRAASLLQTIHEVLRDELEAVEVTIREASLVELSPDAVHVLEMLSAAYGSTPERAPADLRHLIGELATKVWSSASISERRLVLDCIAVADPEVRLRYIDEAFAGRSAWLRFTALRRCGDLTPLPANVAGAIRRLLATLLAGGVIRRDRVALDSDLRRVHAETSLVRLRQVLTVLPFLAFALCTIRFATRLSFTGWTLGSVADAAFFSYFTLVFFWVYQSSTPMSYALRQRGSRIIDRLSKWLLSAERKLETDALWTLAWTLAILGCVGFIGTTVYELLTDLTLKDFLGSVVNLALQLYSLLWPVSALRLLRFPEEHPGTHRILLIPFAPLYFVSEMFWEMVNWGRGLFAYLARTILFVAILLAAFLVPLYLLRRFGGTVGAHSATVINWILGLIGPTVFSSIILLELLARHRVTAALKRGGVFDEHLFVERLRSVGDSVNVADYVRRLRTQNRRAVESITPSFLNQLMRAIEDPFWTLNHAITAADAKTVLVDSETLASWRGPALDEMGRLFDQIRER